MWASIIRRSCQQRYYVLQRQSFQCKSIPKGQSTSCDRSQSLPPRDFVLSAGLGSSACAGSLIIPATSNPTSVQLQESLTMLHRMMSEESDIPFRKGLQGCVHSTQQWGMASAPTRLNRSSSRHTIRRPHYSHSSMRRRASPMFPARLYLSLVAVKFRHEFR